MTRPAILLVLLAAALGCQKSADTPTIDFGNPTQTTAFADGIQTGKIQGNFVPELSGIAASRQNPGKYWVHGDGTVREIYLIDSTGNELAILSLPTSVTTNDCEDIACGEINGLPYIFLADIGDNNGQYKTHQIYQILDPKLPNDNPVLFQFLAPTGVVTTTFQYPGSICPNAESLIFDQNTGDFFIATKDATASIFTIPAAQQGSTATVTAEKIAVLPIDKCTAGDASPDGSEIFLKNKQSIFYWKLPAGGSISNALANQKPELAPYQAETQGEAICFNIWATGYFTSTEIASASEQPIWFYVRK